MIVIAIVNPGTSAEKKSDLKNALYDDLRTKAEELGERHDTLVVIRTSIRVPERSVIIDAVISPKAGHQSREYCLSMDEASRNCGLDFPMTSVHGADPDLCIRSF